MASYVTWSNGGANYPPAASSTTITAVAPAIVLAATSTSPGKAGDNTSWTATVTIPEGTILGGKIVLVENTATWLGPIAGTSLDVGTLYNKTINATSYWCTVDSASFTDNICFSKDPEAVGNQAVVALTYTIDVGTIVNGYTDDVARTQVFTFDPVVIEAAATTGSKTIVGRLTRTNPATGSPLNLDSSSVAYTVLTPAIRN